MQIERQTSRKSINGIVVSNKNKNTAVVAVDTYKKHPLYSKRYKSTKRYQVHVSKIKINLGDLVRIDECRPISKTKKFRLVEVIESKKEGK